MRKYDAYKDSGIEWIGEIPSHWAIATIGRLSNLGRGRVISAIEIAENEGEYPVYSSQTENNGVMGRLNSFDFEGDYVTWTTDGANAGTVFYREGKFNCTNVCGTIQPKNWEQIDLKFLPYYLNLGTKFSVRLDINPKLMNNMMAKIPLVIPPKKEQTAIAAYLDGKTAEIDELIADKKRMLELYAAEKTAIINQAVTKGIKHDVPMKDSGIEWLGEIPAHWEVKRVKHVLKSLNSIRVPLSADERGKMILREYDYYGASGIIDKVEDYLFNEPLLLIGEDGANLVTRNTRLSFIARGKYWVNNHAHILKPTFGLLEYYCELMELCDYSIWISGSAQPKLTSENLMNIQIIVPPIDEQYSIVEHIETECGLIDAKSAKTKTMMALLSEYRTALISEVVTGKLKVIP
jgi:type I restriction enzyme, S subunit